MTRVFSLSRYLVLMEALAVRDAAQRIPAIEGTLISEDGRATAIYVPIERKDQSYRIAEEILARCRETAGEDFIIIYRLSMLDLVPDGNTWDEIVEMGWLGVAAFAAELGHQGGLGQPGDVGEGREPQLHETPSHDVMTRGSVTLRPDLMVGEALRILQTKRISAAIVTNRRRPVGLVTMLRLLNRGAA